ncbi:unnamed protein product [Vicia faba]|uniref:Pentatricopeptide repeat-containing protein n=1 Tax=Vicia faba TaxID=3906 RepID=A0AAV0YGN7_VICFA|nr:unnamed protein product [Vicia faba]
MGASADDLLDLLAQMEHFDISSNTTSFNLVLKVMHQVGEMLDAEKLFERMLQSGDEALPDDESYDLVIRMLFSTDRIDAAFKYIDLTLKHGNMLSINLFMNRVRSCVKQGRLDTLVPIIEKCRATDQNKALCPSWNLCIFIAEDAFREDNSKLAYYGLEFMARCIVKGERARPPKAKVLFHIPTIPRPQDEFTIIVNIVESLLDYYYVAAWDIVFDVVSAMFHKLGSTFTS